MSEFYDVQDFISSCTDGGSIDCSFDASLQDGYKGPYFYMRFVGAAKRCNNSLIFHGDLSKLAFERVKKITVGPGAHQCKVIRVFYPECDLAFGDTVACATLTLYP